VQREFLDWPVTPVEWVILLTVRLNGGSIDEETLQKHLLYEPTKPKSYVLSGLGFVNALKNLTIDNARRDAWLVFKDETVCQLREESFAYGKKTLTARDVCTRFWCLDLSDRGAKRLLDVSFRGEKAEGVLSIFRQLWRNGKFTGKTVGSCAWMMVRLMRAWRIFTLPLLCLLHELRVLKGLLIILVGITREALQ
jgi:hypothetical protein